MNDLQNNELTTYKTIKAFFELPDIVSQFSTNTPLVTAFAAFKTHLANIIIATEDQAQITTGYTAQAHTTRKELITAAVAFGNAASVYFTLNNDLTTAAQLKTTKSTLTNIAYNECKTACQNISTIIDDNIANLDPDYITLAENISLKNLVKNYDDQTTEQYIAKKSTALATLQLANSFKAIQETLAIIDNLMGKYIFTNPTLLEDYHKASQVFNLGHHHSGAEGTVTQATVPANASSIPIYLQDVIITETLSAKTVKTDAAGHYMIDGFTTGQHTFTATLTGYKPQIFTLNVQRGKHTKHDLQLVVV